MTKPDDTPPLDGDKTPTPPPLDGDKTPTPALDAGTVDGVVESADGSTVTMPKSMADEWAAQRKEANRQAKAKSKGEKEATARAEAAEAKVKAFEDKDKTESERAQEAEAAATARADKAERDLKTANLLGDVTAAGAKSGRCSRAVLADLDEALEADPKLDKAEWLKKYKEDTPEFFGGNGTPAPAPDTLGGNPPTPPTAEVARLNKDLKDYEELNKTERDRNTRISNQRAIRILKGKIAQHGG